MRGQPGGRSCSIRATKGRRCLRRPLYLSIRGARAADNPEPAMALLQRLGLRKRDPEQAVRAEQVTALQSALNRCRQVAIEAKRMQRGLTAVVAVLMLALGFALGTYRDQLKQGIAVRQDYVEALRWFHVAADQGDAIAQFNLGVIYSEGLGVPQDNAEAAKWYRLAADQGNPQAQYNLGLWYAQGEGGTPDTVLAYMWFNLAVARFSPSDTRARSLAANSRDAIAVNMSSEQIAEAQRLAREWKPR